MTKRKKIILFITALVVFIIFYMLYSSIRDNYCLGWELYHTSNDVLHQVSNLTESIDYLEEEFKYPDKSADKVDRYFFDESIRTIRWNFGYENMPLLDDVRIEWINRFEEIYEQARSNEDLQTMFYNGEQKPLQNQLKNLAEILTTFCDSYSELPTWKHYFTSWRDVRDDMSDQARIVLAE